ncbi:hypothetical protein EZV62_020085 [Acer yangbiense]|uniref:Uncharacterized protein n=1 Tax=Acer yangbiense TaxID=1000413 RepID=A0A5C7HD99_9ROSI|nr:hypothetical protein EZV62_020085 [Acer yangbiense]
MGILMNFLVEKFGLKPSEFVRRPNLFLVSFERRIIPRWSVIKVLKSKKLLEMDVDVGLSLAVSSMDFEKKFVIPYMDRMPETLPVTTTTSSKPTDQQPLTVSYLTNSWGLSLEEAISASKKLKIENTENPDSVLQLLTSHGFNKSHIARLISKNPRIVLADPEKNLKPKIEYFQSLGVSGSDLPTLLSSTRNVLATSLKNQIVPFIDFLKGFLQTDENLTRALLKASPVIGRNMEKEMIPNINTLRAYGVPEPHIMRLIFLAPRSIFLRIDLFEKMVDAIKKIGFEPTTDVCSYLCKEDGDIDEFLSGKVKPSDFVRRPNLFLPVSSMDFEKKFVIPYMDKTPEVMRAYQGGA